MPRVLDYIAAYDVSSDAERERVAKVLEGFGFRVQRSVFEIRVTRGQREELRRRLEKLELTTGFVALYRWDTAAKRFETGKVPPRIHDDHHHAFII